MTRAPIDAMIDRVVFRCTICNARMGACDCWTECACGWSFRKGEQCRNPKHGAAFETPGEK